MTTANTRATAYLEEEGGHAYLSLPSDMPVQFVEDAKDKFTRNICVLCKSGFFCLLDADKHELPVEALHHTKAKAIFIQRGVQRVLACDHYHPSTKRKLDVTKALIEKRLNENQTKGADIP